MPYQANSHRYETMKYNRVGKSGLKLPAISLGMWHNFGGINSFENAREIARTAFDAGITHFDLANNYGPPPCSAEETMGQLLRTDFASHRDELVIATKAGYWGWDGPYGDWGSRKYLIASLDQSLKRMGLDYVDIYYHHRPDPETPLEETMMALDHVVRQGKALYIGISNYNSQQTAQAAAILRQLGTPCLINQSAYSMLNRSVEADHLPETLDQTGMGMIAFVPLAQGLLTSKYLNGIPEDSRAAGPSQFLNSGDITEDRLARIRKLNELAQTRGQTLAEMALAWVLRTRHVASALIGASRPAQVLDNVKCLQNLSFTDAELASVDQILK